MLVTYVPIRALKLKENIGPGQYLDGRDYLRTPCAAGMGLDVDAA